MSKASEQGTAEDRLIARYFKPLATHPGALGLTDDVACLTPPPGCDLVLTTDAIVAGVHFFPDDPPGMLARKAMRVNLSDLAGKGARPLGFLLSIGLTSDVSETWLSSFAKGLQKDAETYGCPLLGGDTDRVPGSLSVTVAMLGTVPSGTMVHRAGAKPGDRLFVTGTVGDAALGVRLRRGAPWTVPLDAREFLLSRYLLPQPRIELAEAVRTYCSAAMDVSDGLAGDATKLCRVSGVAASISVPMVPISDAARAALAADPALIEPILTGGDDYEILCAVPRDNVEPFQAAAAAAKVSVTEIGAVWAGEGVSFIAGDGTALEFVRAGYSHF